MREENHSGGIFLQNLPDSRNRIVPARRIILSRLEIHAFQPIRPRLDKSEANVVAAGRQLGPPLRLPRFVAPLRDGHVHHIETGLAHQSQRQASDDYFVIRVRRKDQRPGSVPSRVWLRRRAEASQWKGFALRLRANKVPHKMLIRTMFAVTFFELRMCLWKSHFTITGRLAAAIACPWRFSFSSGKCNL